MISMAGDFNLILTLDDKSSTIVEIPGCGCWTTALRISLLEISGEWMRDIRGLINNWIRIRGFWVRSLCRLSGRSPSHFFPCVHSQGLARTILSSYFCLEGALPRGCIVSILRISRFLSQDSWKRFNQSGWRQLPSA
jgi:hypothetical protein